MTASPYDTAWVAMVPHPSSHQDPCFDHCLDWILQNQHENGSWGNFNLGPSLLKDKLSSTLACVLALKKWSCGEEHIKNGNFRISFVFLFSYIKQEITISH